MTVTTLLNNVQGLGNTTQGASDLLGRLQTGSFWSQLRPASYRGIGFGVLSGSGRFGRRNAVHEYPFRDTPWVEDLGRSGRRFTVTGFLVGDDVIAQRDQLLVKVEQKGDGELVHPTLGKRKVALLDFACVEHWDQGRVFEVTFTCMEQGQRQYPAQVTSGISKITSAATLSNAAAAAAFVSKTLSALQTSAKAANEAAQQAGFWAGVALQAGRDATSLINLAAALPGDFGRLLGQASGVKVGQIVAPVIGLTPQALRGISAASRGKVIAATSALAAASAALGPKSGTAYAVAAQALAESVRAAAATPGDAIRALGAMAAYETGTPVTGASATVQTESAAMLRRAAAVSMARAGAEFRAASSGDALLVRDAIVSVLDQQIALAGDGGSDEVYAQFRDLRATVAFDLNARGGLLPELQTVSLPSSLPALTLSYRLYGTADRSDELVQRARPVHPAFMPATFRALSA